MGKSKHCKECDRDAGYGFKNGSRDYCKNHKKDGMINLKGKSTSRQKLDIS